MINPPTKLEEAKKHRYNQWAGNPKGYAYKYGLCAYELYDRHLPRQCTRKNGHGAGNLYCKQHAKYVR